MGIHGRQMVTELNGTACLPFQLNHKPQQMIMRGRQFGEDTSEFYVIEAAVASLAARAAATLRREHQLACRATVTLRTNRHKPGYQQIGHTVQFYTPTADTGAITSQLIRELAARFNPRLAYHKAEVLLHELIPEQGIQTDLLGLVDIELSAHAQRKMHVVDAINKLHGSGAISFAAEHLSQAWKPKRQLVSPRYTSTWDELPEVQLR
jgi:DNA polymerase V